MTRLLAIILLAAPSWLTGCSDNDCEGGICANCPNPGCPEVGGGGAGGTGAHSGGGGNNPGGGGVGGMPTCTDMPELCSGATPVCDAGDCVQCTTAEDDACMGLTPVCNAATNLCQPCQYHAECPNSACNPFTGACLNATPETIGPAGDHTTIAAALASVSAGGEAVFRISPGSYNENPAPPNLVNRTVALLAEGGRPTIRADDGGSPTLTVTNGATLLIDGIDLRGNTASRALQVDGLVALDGVEVTQNTGGGVNATSTAELLIRNSIVAANGFTATAIGLGQGKLDLLYSAVGGAASPSAALDCSPGHQVTMRNSIVFNRSGDPTLLTCSNATISNSAGDDTLSGTDNDTFTVDMSLFINLDSGDLRLTAAGKTQFENVAEWQTGDPATDIDGGARPTANATADVAGAHLGP